MSPLITKKELATRLGVVERTIERYIVTGEGPRFVRIGPRKIGFREADVEAWLSEHSFAHRAAEMAKADELSREVA